ncbi:MBL fold metallo-hydrolase [Salinadaptatus halalkaliphilus]|uniref:MBL fold metallo-hydrolase n=2 Tax=Salinadaptatus halalkaliphilus TaxID=2419781 RepID=A0A4S3TMS9_9EURY|nr:MBL fold metallo-hydrolase [Salinadaptatus halalkaliphilus]
MEWPPNHTVAYLVDGDEPLLVDAGMYGNRGQEELLAGLEACGYRPADIEHLLVTHTHVDHVGQVRTVLEAGDPTVYAPTRVRKCFDRELGAVATEIERNLAEAGLESEALETAVDRFCEIKGDMRTALPLECVDVWIDAGERVDIAGREFEPIYAPGHHVTHCCYGTTLGEDDVVFAGDMAIEPFRAAAIHSNFDDHVSDGIDAYFDALDRLEAYSFDRVYPGHGPVHERYAEAITDAQTDLEARLKTCVDNLEACTADGDAATAMELDAERVDERPDQVQQLREIVAILATLERRGRVRSSLEDGVRFYEPV